MNYWKILAFIFTLLAFGALSETYRIFTSDSADISSNRNGLMIMSLAVTIVIIALTAYFWKKSNKKGF